MHHLNPQLGAVARFAVAALVALASVLAFDLAYVLTGQHQGPLRVPDWIFYAATYGCFFWASAPLFPQSPSGLLLRMGTALLALVFWFPFMVLAMLMFHPAIGGTK